MKKIIFFIVLIISITSCQENIVILKPIMITEEPENVLTNSAILGGKVLGEGGTNVTEYGLVWSTNFPPTIEDNKIIIGERIGFFSDTYGVFEPATTYFYSAYGINSEGIGYGDIWEFTTSEEAPCNPLENYLNVTTNLSPLQSGNYTNIDVLVDQSNFGGDYVIRARRGLFSTHTELDIHFDGTIDDLQSGAYPTVSDLDFAFQIPNKAVVTLFNSNKRFILSNDNIVYVDRVDENTISLTLCDVHFSGTINFTLDVEIDLSTNIIVNQ